MTIQSDPVPSDLTDAEYLLSMIDTTFGGVPEVKRHHERMRAIASRLAPTRETAPALSELSAETVCAAINAIGDEASRRGEMYPQTSDEQREDRASVRRVCEMVRWYEKNTGCARIKGWPVIKGDREQRPAALSEADPEQQEWVISGGGLPDLSNRAIELRQHGYKLLERVTDMNLSSTDRYTAEKELNRVLSQLADLLIDPPAVKPTREQRRAHDAEYLAHGVEATRTGRVT